MPNNKKYGYRRICVQRPGYAIVPGNTDEEALANLKGLKENDFEWEPVTDELLSSEAEVVEPCGPNGEVG